MKKSISSHNKSDNKEADEVDRDVDREWEWECVFPSVGIAVWL